jgi:quinol monooxygenase YgiN
MPAITALLDLRITADSVAGAKEVIDGVLVDTRAFPGCLGVEVLVDIADGAHFLLVEKWESIEHDRAYRAWRATPEGASALSTIVASLALTQFVEA